MAGSRQRPRGGYSLPWSTSVQGPVSRTLPRQAGGQHNAGCQGSSDGQPSQGHGVCRPRNLPSTGSSVIPSASAITSPWEARASMLPRMT